MMATRTRAKKPLHTFVFILRTGSNGTYGKSTYEQDAATIEEAVTKLFKRFKDDGLLAFFASLEHIATETME
jgi:hypothetical protein